MAIIPDPTDAELLAAYPRGEHPVIDRAEAAILAWGNVDRVIAAGLLDSWAHRAELTDRERAAVLARFPRTMEHLTYMRQGATGIDVLCTCRKWSSVVATVEEGNRDAAAHRDNPGGDR
ncbi:hypothetical protein [Phytohabitans kaempferiae]|uniref:DUF222 domain-containing protein n=1 Tax=Phytohabitans kaempferiae TaxID=1620943 RepID=A0ABV6LZY6_9ACTN